jgi:hypothetical protein
MERLWPLFSPSSASILIKEQTWGVFIPSSETVNLISSSSKKFLLPPTSPD